MDDAAVADRDRQDARWARAEQLRAQRAAEWNDPRHPGCCHRCGWHVSSHLVSSYGLDCPLGASPAAQAGHLPAKRTDTYRILGWDYRQQIDLDELAKALSDLGRVDLHQIDTGSDEYAIVLTSQPMTAEEADQLYRAWEENGRG